MAGTIWRKIGNPTAIKSSIFRDEIEREVKTIEKAALDDFKRTTATWKHKPKFTATLKKEQDRITLTVGTDDLQYKFVDGGTRVRYAVMSKDFKAKTQPDVILSTPGKGKVLFVSKKHPRPGIKARHFTKWIMKSITPEFKRVVKNALQRFTRRTGSK